MTALAGRVFWISLSTSVVLLPLLLLAGPICRRYRAKSCYVLWLLLALRLLIPVEIPLPQAPVTVEVPVVEFTVLETPQTGVELPVQNQTNPTVVQPSPVRRDISTVEILGLIWAAGVVLLLAAQWINYSTLKQKLWNNSLGNPTDQQQLAQLGAAVPVLRGDVESPLTFGLLHPAIFLPRELPQEDVPMVLRHELCHLRRRDLWYKGMLLLCACIHWFNPLVWKLGKVAGEHLELCCDEDVVAGQDIRFRKEYGQLLLRSAAAGQRAALATQFGGSDLKGRIMNLFTKKKRGAALVCAVTCAALMMGSLVGCEVSAVGNSGEPEISEQTENVAGKIDVKELKNSIVWGENGEALTFSLPELDENQSWTVQISGRYEAKDGMSMSVHLDVPEECAKGGSCTVEVEPRLVDPKGNGRYTELVLVASVDGEEQAMIDLMGILTEDQETVVKEPLLWPVEGEYTLSALYGDRVHPLTGQTSSHNGIDIVADGGTEVQAVQSGVVTESDFDKQYGNYVLIAHEGGTSTLYAQLKECKVEENDTVTQGQVIGTVGKTGMATGEHLHFEIYQDGARLDPVDQYGEIQLQIRDEAVNVTLEK